MKVSSLLVLGFAGAVGAQQAASAPDLPRAFRLGPLPKAAIEVSVGSDGIVPHIESASGREWVLRVDAAAPVTAIDKVLRLAAAAERDRVWFAARLPNGQEGAFVLAPPQPIAVATMTVSLDYGRTAVPPESATPVLRRLAAARTEPVVLGVSAPANARWGDMLGVLAAAAEAGIDAAVLRLDPAVQESVARRPALRLGPVVEVIVQPHAVACARPAVLDVPFGLGRRADAQGEPQREVAFGGAYGGRRVQTDPDGLAKLVREVQRWLTTRQHVDGAFVAGDAASDADVETTALVALGMLTRSTVHAGEHAAELRRAIGWLLAVQRPDGAFVDEGPGAVRAQALACWALVEAEGLSRGSALCCAAAEDGMRWLAARQRDDGGFRAVQAAAADPLDNALAAVAFSSLRFFEFRGIPAPRSVVAWFDANPAETPRAMAAELLTRVVAADISSARVMDLAEHLAGVDAAGDPWLVWMASTALVQVGGTAWGGWAPQLRELAERAERAADGQRRWSATGGVSSLLTTSLLANSLRVHQRMTRIVR